jgi:hypothetical protein
MLESARVTVMEMSVPSLAAFGKTTTAESEEVRGFERSRVLAGQSMVKELWMVTGGLDPPPPPPPHPIRTRANEQKRERALNFTDRNFTTFGISLGREKVRVILELKLDFRSYRLRSERLQER